MKKNKRFVNLVVEPLWEAGFMGYIFILFMILYPVFSILFEPSSFSMLTEADFHSWALCILIGLALSIIPPFLLGNKYYVEEE